MIYHYEWQEIPYKFLGRLDDPAFSVRGVKLIYTPATSTTRRIMGRVASGSVLKGNAARVLGAAVRLHRSQPWAYQPSLWWEGKGFEHCTVST